MAQRFHSFELANNVRAKNFHVEELAADPVVTKAGRSWYNSVDKAYRFSDIDAGGAVVKRTFADKESMLTALAALQTSLTNGLAGLQTAVDAEAASRVAGDTAANDAIAAEIAARTKGDSDESAARIAGDATEAQQRTDAIAVAAATAADAVATESTARLAGDDALGVRIDGVQAELDATQSGAGLGADGVYTAPENTTYLSTTASLKDAAVKLDAAVTAEVTRSTAADASLASALANEAQSRADGDANLQSQLQAWVNQQIVANDEQDAAQLAAETAARITAISGLQAELDQTQATIGTDVDGKLLPITNTNYLNEVTTVFGGAFALDAKLFEVAESLTAETTARETADSAFIVSLNSEIANRTAGDVAIQTELDQIEVGAGLETDGKYAAGTNTNYLNAATSLKDADSKLDAAIKSVADRATAIETTSIPELQAQVTAEVTRATAAEAAESSARQAADSTLTEGLAAEVTRAQSAEQANATAITGEVTRATASESNLQSQITALAAAAGDGASALKATLNATRFQYLATEAKTEHVITHNMGTEFYSINMMVKGSDGVWVNDIVPVEDVSVNVLKVTLPDACIIKASGQSNAALA